MPNVINDDRIKLHIFKYTLTGIKPGCLAKTVILVFSFVGVFWRYEMSRKTKTGLDYFPHDCIFDDNLEYIIAKYQEIGYYIFFRLLEKIYFENGYYFLANEKNLILLSSKINVNIEYINDIINECLSEHLFNKMLHDKYKILTSKGIQDRYFEAIKRRKEVELIKEYILIDNVNIILQNVDIKWLNVDKSTQSRVEKSRVKESKEFNFKSELINLKIEPQIISDWLKVRSTKKASNTETAFNRIKSEIEKSGLTANECIKKAVEKDWKGFESEWLKNGKEDSKKIEY